MKSWLLASMRVLLAVCAAAWIGRLAAQDVAPGDFRALVESINSGAREWYQSLELTAEWRFEQYAVDLDADLLPALLDDNADLISSARQLTSPADRQGELNLAAPPSAALIRILKAKDGQRTAFLIEGPSDYDDTTKQSSWSSVDSGAIGRLRFAYRPPQEGKNGFALGAWLSLTPIPDGEDQQGEMPYSPLVMACEPGRGIIRLSPGDSYGVESEHAIDLQESGSLRIGFARTYPASKLGQSYEYRVSTAGEFPVFECRVIRSLDSRGRKSVSCLLVVSRRKLGDTVYDIPEQMVSFSGPWGVDPEGGVEALQTGFGSRFLVQRWSLLDARPGVDHDAFVLSLDLATSVTGGEVFPNEDGKVDLANPRAWRLSSVRRDIPEAVDSAGFGPTFDSAVDRGQDRATGSDREKDVPAPDPAAMRSGWMVSVLCAIAGILLIAGAARLLMK